MGPDGRAGADDSAAGGAQDRDAVRRASRRLLAAHAHLRPREPGLDARDPRRVEWGSNDGDTRADHRTDGAGDGSSDEAEGARAAGDGERSRLQ